MSEQKTIPIQAVNEASNCASAEPYALMVLGDSMLPEFEEGEIIVVEPSGLVKDGSYVVAFVNEEYIFRQASSSATPSASWPSTEPSLPNVGCRRICGEAP